MICLENYKFLFEELIFLVFVTRLYKLLCRSVGWSVGRSLIARDLWWSALFKFNYKNFILQFCKRNRINVKIYFTYELSFHFFFHITFFAIHHPSPFLPVSFTSATPSPSSYISWLYGHSLLTPFCNITHLRSLSSPSLLQIISYHAISLGHIVISLQLFSALPTPPLP